MKEIEEIRSYCLNCKNSQCRIKGCPLGNCIPEFIHETDSKKAYEILCNTTILPAICGRICPHEKQCEGSCIRGIKGEPVSIGAMEAYIGDLSIENNYELSIEVDERAKDKRVAVIGSGPAGLTCAAFLARRGVKVVIYEKHDKLGGLLTHGIPEFRLPREVVEKTIEKILDLGVETKLNQELGRDFDIEDLEVISDNEIGSLTRSFNVMTHRIWELMEQNVKEQEQKRKIELKALQSQINPHFLYNTLDSIIWMAEGKKNEEVVIMTASLARLLRQSISNEDELVTVGQEIEYVRSYLTIQKMRYKDKLEFEIKADPSITQVPIIRLVLQPLVENAIYHGLKYKDSKGLLTVHGYMKGENAVIDITDDGVGMDEETLKHIYDKHKVNYRSNGVGVYNVQQRLVLYYGKDYGIIYHSEKGKGTTASVVIPGIQEESHEKS